LDEAVTRILERPYIYPEKSTEKVIENYELVRNEQIESFVGENFPQ
jgi:hypothetical protein